MPATTAQQASIDYGKVSHLARKAVATNIQMPIHDERSSNTSPDRKHHDIATTDRNPADPLGEERAVGIVFQIRRGTGELTDNIRKRHISHAGHVGGKQQNAALLVDHAGTPDAGTHDGSPCIFRPEAEVAHSFQNKL
jgi:hypothetical protein